MHVLLSSEFFAEIAVSAFTRIWSIMHKFILVEVKIIGKSSHNKSYESFKDYKIMGTKLTFWHFLQSTETSPATN